MPTYINSRLLAESGEVLTPEFLGKAGRAVAALIGGAGTVVVGCAGDAEAGQKDALAQGLAAGGCVVADVGAAPRALVDFGRRLLRAHTAVYAESGDGGSVRIFVEDAPATRGHIEAIRRSIEGGEVPEKDGGDIEAWDEDIAEEYFEWLRGAVAETPKAEARKAVVMTPPGALTEIARRVAETRTGLTLEVIPQEAPVRLPRSGVTTPEVDELGGKVKESEADFGALVDADGILVRFVDEKGKAVSADALGMILLKKLFADLKGRKIVLDARMRQALANEIKKGGGEAVFARLDEGAVQARAQALGAALGLGADGGVVFPEIRGSDALYTVLRVGEMLRAAGDSLNKLRLDQKLPPVIGDVVVACRPEWFHSILSRIRSNYPRQRQVEVNGVRVRLDEGWAVAVALEEDQEMLYRFGGKDQETVEAIAAEIIDSAIEIRDKARRLAGLPERPPQEDLYEDYGAEF